MSLYFKSEEDTMKNEIPAAIFLAPQNVFFGWSHSVWDIACYKIMLFFYHQDTVFERNLFHNGHKQ